MKRIFQMAALLLDISSWLYPFLLAITSSILTAKVFVSLLPEFSINLILAAMPILYLAWLFIFICLGALGSKTIFLGSSKPDKLMVDLRFTSPQDLYSFARASRITAMYRMGMFMQRLPILNYFALSPVGLGWLNKIVLRAYSPKTYIGEGSLLFSRPQDPDLTYIGKNVIVGSECILVSHALNTSFDRKLKYSTAPIEISDFAVIGGGSYLGPGVKVGKGAVVQMRSYLPPFTHVGPREVWGGNPAVFQRMVSGSSQNLNESSISHSATLDKSAASEQTFISDSLPHLRDHTHNPENQKRSVNTENEGLNSVISNIIAKAIHFKPEDITDALNSDNCISWDSMAQMSIASAIYDQFSIDIAPENIFQLRSRQAVKQIILDSQGISSIANESVLNSPVVSPLSVTEKAEIQEDKVDDLIFNLPENSELLPLFEIESATKALAKKESNHSKNIPFKRILFVSTFTLQPLKSPLEVWCQAFKVPVEANFLEFDQIEQTLLSESSEFFANSQGLNVVLTRPEDLFSERDESGMARGEQLMEAIRTFSKRQSGLVVSNLPPLISVFSSANRLRTEQLRVWWQKELEQIEGIQIFDFAGVIEELGRQAARDTSMEVIARAPYSQPAYQQLGIAVSRLIRKTFLPAKKVIALDCDNTLWGGIVGEDGIDGLALSDDYPGRSFRLFQKHLLEYRKRGILLVLVSKNEESDVWQVFDQHPEMLIRRSDVAGYRINWQSKSENLRALAKELNLGLDSFVFVDDSPTERMEVATNSPEVTVVPMPTDATRYVETLSKLWCFDTASLTAEDSKRTEYMLQEQERQSLQQEASNLENYLEALNLVVSIHPATNRDLPRVAQLTQKTNQFNLSLIRRSLNEIQQLKQTHQVLVMNVADRFGDYGLVGLAIIAVDYPNLVLDTFLMSCRVLGRGVEDALLSVISKVALEKELMFISAPYQAGPRNNQLKEFLIRNGFSENSPDIFSIKVSEIPCAPKHIKIQFEQID